MKPPLLCSLSLWERVGVRALTYVTTSIVARLEPRWEFCNSFRRPTYGIPWGPASLPVHFLDSWMALNARHCSKAGYY